MLRRATTTAILLSHALLAAAAAGCHGYAMPYDWSPPLAVGTACATARR
jgi:hypothetical protein